MVGNKRFITALSAAGAIALIGMGVSAASADTQEPTAAPVAAAAAPWNSVNSNSVVNDSLTTYDFKDGTILQRDLAPALYSYLRTPQRDGVSGWQVKDKSLTLDDLADSSKAALQGKDGTNGTNGTNGTDGKDGTNGTNGKDGVSGLAVDGPTKTAPKGFSEVKLECTDGKKAISGGLKWDSGAGAAKDVTMNGSYPSDLAEVGGAWTATSWTVALTNNSNGEIGIQPFVTCVTAN